MGDANWLDREGAFDLCRSSGRERVFQFQSFAVSRRLAWGVDKVPVYLCDREVLGAALYDGRFWTPVLADAFAWPLAFDIYTLRDAYEGEDAVLVSFQAAVQAITIPASWGADADTATEICRPEFLPVHIDQFNEMMRRTYADHHRAPRSGVKKSDIDQILGRRFSALASNLDHLARPLPPSRPLPPPEEPLQFQWSKVAERRTMETTDVPGTCLNLRVFGNDTTSYLGGQAFQSKMATWVAENRYMKHTIEIDTAPDFESAKKAAEAFALEWKRLTREP